jgi:cell division protein FtsZ
MIISFDDVMKTSAEKAAQDADDEFDFDEDELDNEAVYKVIIKVFGVGGGGSNALAHMAKKSVSDPKKGIEYIAVNTDVPALRKLSGLPLKRIQIGRKTAKGRGAGGNPEVAAEAAREDTRDIEKCLEGASLVFIAAGMGGGTGTGACPVIAEVARKKGILTVGVVTKPFKFERDEKMNQALKGINELRKQVDALVIIPNQKLVELSSRELTVVESYAMVDDVLCNVVSSISELLSTAAYQNVDFSDLQNVLGNSGDAHIAVGRGSGESKVDDCVSMIVKSPLLETSIANAGKLLIFVRMKRTTLLSDLNTLMDKLSSVARKDVVVKHGTDYADDQEDDLVVSVIATGFAADPISSKQPPSSKTSDGKAQKAAVAAAADDVTTTSKKDLSLSDNIRATFGTGTGTRDTFKDLEDLFNSKR